MRTVCSICGDAEWSRGLCKADYQRARNSGTLDGYPRQNRPFVRGVVRSQRDITLWRYGLTEQEFDARLMAQGGHCALCPATVPGGNGTWHVDHDHSCCPQKGRSCGKCVRGLLCSRCNLEVGMIEKHRANLPAIFAYLDQNKPQKLPLASEVSIDAPPCR